MTRERELFNALKVLQEECRRHEYCGDCPLSKNVECRVTNTAFGLPSGWKLNSPENA